MDITFSKGTRTTHVLEKTVDCGGGRTKVTDVIVGGWNLSVRQFWALRLIYENEFNFCCKDQEKFIFIPPMTKPSAS